MFLTRINYEEKFIQIEKRIIWNQGKNIGCQEKKCLLSREKHFEIAAKSIKKVLKVEYSQFLLSINSKKIFTTRSNVSIVDFERALLRNR